MRKTLWGNWRIGVITALFLLSTFFPVIGLGNMYTKTIVQRCDYMVFFDNNTKQWTQSSNSAIDLIAYDIWISDQFYDTDKQHIVEDPVEGQRLYYHMQERIDPPQIVPRHLLEGRLDGSIRFSTYVETNRSAGVLVVFSGENTPYIAEVGVHTLMFKVDVNNNVTELNESNNIKTFTFTVEPNHAPVQPDVPSGPSIGYINTSYAYSSLATDIDGDQIQYRFDWGDGMPYSDWTNLVSSGTSANKSHVWSSPGIYNVSAQARDEHGLESNWSNQLPVTIEIGQNQPPEDIVIYGSSIIIAGTQAIYSVSAIDKDGDTIRCLFDWGDGTQNWTTYFPSGDYASLSHTWIDKGNYVLRVKAQDEHGTESNWITKSIVVPKTYDNPFQQFIEKLLNWITNNIFKIYI